MLMITLILYRQVGVDHRTIATMYSVRAAGTVASSLLVGYLFGSSFFTQKPGEGGCRKLALLSISQAIIAVSLMAVPFVKSFSVLLIRLQKRKLTFTKTSVLLICHQKRKLTLKKIVFFSSNPSQLAQAEARQRAKNLTGNELTGRLADPQHTEL